jgi:hypothetical protein
MLARKTSQQGRPNASCAEMPVISSAARLKNVIRQSRSMVKTPSAMLFKMISVCGDRVDFMTFRATICSYAIRVCDLIRNAVTIIMAIGSTNENMMEQNEPGVNRLLGHFVPDLPAGPDCPSGKYPVR